MKTKIAHAALLVAFSGAACAQSGGSSVNLSGVVDLSLRQTHNSTGTLRSVSSGNNSTSRLVVRGTEDLGGGLYAGFWLEGSFQADTGVSGTGNQFWDRRSTVQVGGPWGEVRAGRDWTPVYWGFVFGDPWVNTGVGSSSNFLSVLASTTYQRAFLGTGGTTLSRSSNEVEYWLPPNLGGVYGDVMVGLGEGSNASGGFRYRAGRLGYKTGPIDVAIYTGATLLDATGSNLKQTGAFGAYTVGPATLSLNYTHSSYLSSSQDHWTAGVRAGFGLWIVKASYNWLNQKGTNAAGVSIDSNDASQYALGLEYALSKRTAIYSAAAHMRNKGVATFAIPGGPGAIAGGSNSTGFEVGLRHAF